LRWYWLISALLSLLTAALETATAGAIYLLVKLAAEPSRVSAIPVVSALASFLPSFSPATTVFVFAGLFALFHLCKAVFTIWAEYGRELALGKASVRLSSMFFRAYMTAPYSFHLKRNSSELIHHVNDSIGRVLGGAMAAYVNLLLEVLVACGLARIIHER
jgi:ATP-binding cassette, subfamily B, bacterial PglK